MMLFLLIFAVLVTAAAGLAVGSLRGRPLPGGPCAVRAVRGADACAACAAGERIPRERSSGGKAR
jgi:hypothetical protein